MDWLLACIAALEAVICLLNLLPRLCSAAHSWLLADCCTQAFACTTPTQQSEAERSIYLKIHGPGHRKGSLMDGHLLLFTHAEDDGVDLLVLAQDPDYETRHVQVVYELPPGNMIGQSTITADAMGHLQKAGLGA